MPYRTPNSRIYRPRRLDAVYAEKFIGTDVNPNGYVSNLWWDTKVAQVTFPATQWHRQEVEEFSWDQFDQWNDELNHWRIS